MAQPRVGLDVGHGVNTFPPNKGVVRNGRGYAEHDFNAKLCIEIEKLLKHNGIDVVMYQKPFANDINLTQRTNYYNAQKLDLVYSIHADANNNPDVNGIYTFYWHTSKGGKRLAEIVADEVRKAGLRQRGNGTEASMRGSWTNMHICRETNMVGVLTENGFMTGNKDFDYIFGSKQPGYIYELARVHARAICRYFSITFKDTAVAVTPTPPKKEEPKVSNEPSSYHKEAWEKACKFKGVNGVTIFDGTNPKGPVTREQLAEILVRLGLVK